MNFNDISFYLFLFAVISLYRVLPWKGGRLMLVLASYFFYGLANPYYILLLFASTTTDFLVAQKISEAKQASAKKHLLWISLAVNISLLGFFKYADFFIGNFNFLASPLGWDQIEYLNLILPVGISFYTFQTLAYTIDVYRNEQNPETNYIDFALYVGYFPQLVAGPIERAKDLLPQLKKKHKVSQENLMHGLERVLWGLVKKTVIADRLAVPVLTVFQNVESHSGFELFIASACFSFQLYFDFSAYSDIAIGIARMMGVKLSENFSYPYTSRNQSEHWNRWHRTLTIWFRDYIYRSIMKKGERNAMKRIMAILLVFSVTGFWHGASWNKLLFGLIAGLFIVIQGFVKQLPLSRIATFNRDHFFIKTFQILFNHWILWMSLAPFFLLSSFSDAILFHKKIFTEPWQVTQIADEFVLYLSICILLHVIHIIRAQFIPKMRSGDLTVNYNRVPTNLALLLVLIFGAYEYQLTFIYFQF